MIRRKDPLDETLEIALRPGTFIGYGMSFEFVAGLESALSDLLPLIAKEPNRALELVETFIAACYEKIEEVDESDGLGMFIQELFAAWILARQSTKAEPRETILLLLDWRKNDDYLFRWMQGPHSPSSW